VPGSGHRDHRGVVAMPTSSAEGGDEVAINIEWFMVVSFEVKDRGADPGTSTTGGWLGS
jgi:hypothetical protein